MNYITYDMYTILTSSHFNQKERVWSHTLSWLNWEEKIMLFFSLLFSSLFSDRHKILLSFWRESPSIARAPPVHLKRPYCRKIAGFYFSWTVEPNQFPLLFLRRIVA